MTLALLFWILMLFWLLFGCWRNYPFTAGNFAPFGGDLLLFLLLLILGWHEFGPPIR